MKRFLCVLFALLLSLSLAVGAEEDDVLSLLASRDGANGYQEWMDGALADGAGTSAEWCVIALTRGENAPDPARYAEKALKALAETSDPMTGQRIALALLCCGTGRKDAERVAEETYGTAGIMSQIYGLLLLRAVLDGSAEEKAVLLASKACGKGGFALSGDNPSADVTAMALTALAPFRKNEKVEYEIGRALAVLSEMQAEDGTFSAYGAPNPESGAQVLIALAALGIGANDPRFVKEHTILEGIESFRIEDGYCHVRGGGFNRMACVQAALARIALWRAETGLSPLFDLCPVPAPTDGTTEAERTEEEEASASAVSSSAASTEEKKAEKRLPIKAFPIGAIWLAAAAAVILLLKKRRGSAGNLLSVLLAAALLTTLLLTVRFSSEGDYYGAQTEPAEIAGRASVTIRCTDLIGREGIPEDGVLLAPVTYPFAEGDTAWDLLLYASKEGRFQLGFGGAGSMVYVTSIFQIAQTQYGPTSGWGYLVNGEPPSLGSGEYTLSDGDVIEFVYVLSPSELGM